MRILLGRVVHLGVQGCEARAVALELVGQQPGAYPTGETVAEQHHGNATGCYKISHPVEAGRLIVRRGWECLT